MSYEPIYTPVYQDGFKDLPTRETQITAEVMNNIDDAIVHIEEHLASEETGGGGNSSAGSSEISDINGLQDALDGKVPTERTVNGKTLSENITLSASDVEADKAGTADTAVSNHNTSTDAHNDIRDLIVGLTNRLNALADSDDITLDQLSEIVAYIKANKELIDSVTTSKVNVVDIVDNLTTNVSNKPLSAAQGVAIKALIDALQTEVDAKAKQTDLTALAENVELKLEKTGDSKDNTVTFTSGDSTSADSWTDTDVLASGEKHSSILNKISTMFKNIRYLYKILGTTDISKIGDGTVTGGLSFLKTGLEDTNSNLDARSMKTYIGLSQVGMSTNNTVDEIIAALPINTVLTISVSASSTTNLNNSLPSTTSGIVTFTKCANNNRGIIEFSPYTVNKVYRNRYYDAVLSGWWEL